MAKPVVIIHFSPLEQYPPVMNLLNFIAGKNEASVIVFSTRQNGKSDRKFEVASTNIEIKRIAFSDLNKNAFSRYIQYVKFYVGCFLSLLKVRPERILYFETISSFPAFLYKKFIKKDVGIFVHYHEYTSPAEYLTGMKLVRYFHQKEQMIYPAFKWVSHTNPDRLKMFLTDEGLKDNRNYKVLPNYPPKSWQKKISNTNNPPIKIVYVGALSMETTYTSQFAEWVINQNGKVIWDIYSNNISPEAKEFLCNLPPQLIRLREAAEYYELPEILQQYQIGVILYNGHIPNYIYNAPNKLFEYMACGLDVWFPEVMKGCFPYITHNTFPKVMAIDFKNLQYFNLEDSLSRTGLEFKPDQYFCESEYGNLYESLFGKG